MGSGIVIGIGIETGSSLKMSRILVNVLHLTDVSLFHPVTFLFFIFYFYRSQIVQVRPIIGVGSLVLIR